MKITEEELIEELEERSLRAGQKIDEANKMKLPANSYGLGVAYGEMTACEELLKLIMKGEDSAR